MAEVTSGRNLTVLVLNEREAEKLGTLLATNQSIGGEILDLHIAMNG